MPVKPKAQPKQSSAIDLKASSFTLPVLTLLDANIQSISEQLGKKVKQAPEFFKNAPLVIDIGALASTDIPIEFESLVKQISKLGITPIGIRGGNRSQNTVAQSFGLALLADARSTSPTDKKEALAVKKTVQKHASAKPSAMLVKQPVRSGQRIYAVDQDLIILAPVSTGAEVMADGNIHIYGALRGRALAGVKGDTDTRIFCQILQAELIAISGNYQISESFDESLRGKPVQIHLSDNSLLIEEL